MHFLHIPLTCQNVGRFSIEEQDADGDGYSNVDETSCDSNPLNASSTPDDLDGDFIPDCIDSDIDGDGYENTNDLFPLDKSRNSKCIFIT